MAEISEDCCAPTAYVYGGITLSPKAPGQFTIGVRVDVAVIQAAVTGPVSGEDHLLWHYLAVVKPGQVKVRCTIGDVVSAKDVDAKPNEVSIVNFCFGNPVETSAAKSIPKRKHREKERVAPRLSSPGERGVGPASPV